MSKPVRPAQAKNKRSIVTITKDETPYLNILIQSSWVCMHYFVSVVSQQRQPIPKSSRQQQPAVYGQFVCGRYQHTDIRIASISRMVHCLNKRNDVSHCWHLTTSRAKV